MPLIPGSSWKQETIRANIPISWFAFPDIQPISTTLRPPWRMRSSTGLWSHAYVDIKCATKKVTGLFPFPFLHAHHEKGIEKRTLLEIMEKCNLCNTDKRLVFCNMCHITVCKNCSRMEMAGSCIISAWPVYYCLNCASGLDTQSGSEIIGHSNPWTPTPKRYPPSPVFIFPLTIL